MIFKFDRNEIGYTTFFHFFELQKNLSNLRLNFLLTSFYLVKIAIPYIHIPHKRKRLFQITTSIRAIFQYLSLT